jgi:hypothetical protein
MNLMTHIRQMMLTVRRLPMAFIEGSDLRLWKSWAPHSALVSLVEEALNPQTSVVRLRDLSRHSDADVRCAVARNEAAPAKILLGLAVDRSEKVRFWTAHHRNAGREALALLSADESCKVRETVASNPSTPPDILSDMLVANFDLGVCQKVADNPSAGSGALFRAANAVWSSIRRQVAVHPNASEQLLERLSCDPDEDVRLLVARRPHCGQAMLGRLARDRSLSVRRVVAACELAPEDALYALAGDADEDVCVALTENPSSPVKALDVLSRRKWALSYNRRTLRKHPRLPPECGKRMDEDERRALSSERVCSSPSVLDSDVPALADSSSDS